MNFYFQVGCVVSVVVGFIMNLSFNEFISFSSLFNWIPSFENIGVLQLTFMLHYLTPIFMGFFKTFCNFAVDILFATYQMSNSDNSMLVENITNHVKTNLAGWQKTSVNLFNNSSGESKSTIPGQSEELTPGIWFFWAENCLMWVHSGNGNLNNWNSCYELTIYSFCWNANKCTNFITKMIPSPKNSPRPIFMYNSLGWRKTTNTIPINPRTIICSDNQVESIMKDIENFKNSKSYYAEIGQSYKRCYLFHGPPGTGKTSTTMNIASAMGLKAYVMSSTKITPETLINACSKISANSMLIIEDLCTFAKTHQRRSNDDDDDDDDYTPRRHSQLDTITHALMNILDGIHSPNNGLIIVITANDLSTINPTLLRPGRVDKQFYFGCLNSQMAYNMFLKYYPNETEKADTIKQLFKGETHKPSELNSILMTGRLEPIDKVFNDVKIFVSTEPIEQIKPVKPVKPIEPVEPIEPVKPIEQN